MALLSVNGTDLQEPSTYNITKRDLDSENSYTSETGILVRDIIRANHVTIDVAWEHLTLVQFQAIAALISKDNKEEQKQFTLTYFDYYKGTNVTGTFYAHDRSGTAIKVRRITNPNGYEHYQLSTQLIEF